MTDTQPQEQQPQEQEVDAQEIEDAKPLRDASLVGLLVLYLLPMVVVLPPSMNVVLTASLTVFAACLRTVGRTHEVEMLSQKEAVRFPIIGSISLFGLFLAVKFLPHGWLNLIITTYFCVVGVLAIGELVYSTFQGAFPPSLVSTMVINLKGVKIPFLMEEQEDVSMSVARALCNLVGLAVSAWYASSKHMGFTLLPSFLANNALGIAYSLEGVAILHLGSTQVGVILLAGLFVYDIFWVFFTPVMVTVAKSIDGPIKLLFSRNAALTEFSMLGLGDIVIPGLFVSLAIHFDIQYKTKKAYFYAAMIGYCSGLIVTVVVMNVFNAAQPALLYIVPGVFIAVFALAVKRGQVKEFWNFVDTPPRLKQE